MLIIVWRLNIETASGTNITYFWVLIFSREEKEKKKSELWIEHVCTYITITTSRMAGDAWHEMMKMRVTYSMHAIDSMDMDKSRGKIQLPPTDSECRQT